MRILFATAELAPFVKVGGLADASAGLVHALRASGADVDVALPDYGELRFREESEMTLGVPGWARPAIARRGSLDGFESVVLIETPGSRRRNPYLDADGRGWPDNEERFIAFSAAVASLVSETAPDVLHLNDWHAAATLGFLAEPPPSVLTIHNLAYQGHTDGSWLGRLPHHPESYGWHGGTNPLVGAIRLADRLVTVSPTYAIEVLHPDHGFGMHQILADRGDRFTGILNGIETDIWNPATDPHLSLRYGEDTAWRKRQIGRELSAELGWAPSAEPIVGMVTRLTDQKGVDIALAVAELLPALGARMVLLGSGEKALAREARRVAGFMPSHFVFRDGYDETLSHRIFAGSDLYLMPSRFEPGGLAQLQAMRYGAIPIVTDVGGLHDTVIDADADPAGGTGFVAAETTVESVSDALQRALRAWHATQRRGLIRRGGMRRDWSWTTPASRYRALYEAITSAR